MSARPTPDYGQIKAGARLLNGFAMVAWVVGSMAVAAAVLFVVLGVMAVTSGAARRDQRPGSHPRKWIASAADWSAALAAFVAGLLAMVVAATLQMAASLALAVRDMARNSFHRGR